MGASVGLMGAFVGGSMVAIVGSMRSVVGSMVGSLMLEDDSKWLDGLIFGGHLVRSRPVGQCGQSSA
jgi:hypothetical protein